MAHLSNMAHYVLILDLDLTMNGISKLADYSFRSMPSLQVISLQDNNIICVGIHAFSGLFKLKKLNLINNKITEVNFGNIAAGASIELMNNKLTSIDDLSGFSEAPWYMYRHRIDMHGMVCQNPNCMSKENRFVAK